MLTYKTSWYHSVMLQENIVDLQEFLVILQGGYKKILLTYKTSCYFAGSLKEILADLQDILVLAGKLKENLVGLQDFLLSHRDATRKSC